MPLKAQVFCGFTPSITNVVALVVLITILRHPQQSPTGKFERDKVYYLQVLEIIWHTWATEQSCWEKEREYSLALYLVLFIQQSSLKWVPPNQTLSQTLALPKRKTNC